MGRGRSTLLLLIVALGFGGYLYFVDSKRPVEDANAKKKVFTYEADKINQLQVSASGEVTALKKDGSGTWTIVQPAQAPADRNSVSDVVTNLANLEEDRVVDENASDLKAYGLAEPRIDVTFHVDGEKEPKRIFLGDKTPTNMGIYAKLPSGNRVFLVATTLDTTLNKSTFDFRDKSALKFEQDKVTSIDLVASNQAVRLEKTGDDWKLTKPIQAPADFVSVNGLLGQLQSAQMAALREKPEDLKDLEAVRPRQTRGRRNRRHGHVHGQLELGREAEAGHRLGKRSVAACRFQHQHRRSGRDQEGTCGFSPKGGL